MIVFCARAAAITQQVVLNLVLNAADAMSETKAERILTLRTQGGGGEVRMSLTDRGPGIAKENLDTVFDSFWTTKIGGMRPGEKVTTDMPVLINLRQDPFERTPNIRGEYPNVGAFGYGQDFFAREFWRFVMVQQYVAELAETAIDYPPMQDPRVVQSGRGEEEDRGDDPRAPGAIAGRLVA